MTADFSWLPKTNIHHDHKHLAGRLLLHNEIPLHQNEIESLLHLGVITKIPSIEKTRFGHQCRRCGNTKPYKFATFPHAACQKQCRYCRNCIQMGRVTECETLYFTHDLNEWPRYTDPCAWQGELTIHQQKAAKALESLVGQKGEMLIWAVCGAGKTEMLFPAITKALKTGKRICLATPRTDVVRELLPRFKSAFPEAEISALYGDSENKQTDASFIIATTHQLLRFAHAFDVMIIDEVDAFPYHNDASLHFAAERARKTDGTQIYLTATPRKKEKRRIRKKSLPVVFIPKRFHGHPLPVPKLKLSFTLPKHLKKGSLPPGILTSIQNSTRQRLLFLPTIDLTEKITDFLNKEGIPAVSVHSEDPDRPEKIEQFRQKAITTLATTTILERGVTFPSVDVFVIDAGHTVFDEAALVQIAGRAGRSPDDPTGHVHFYHSGKTDAILDARDAIITMNKRAVKS